jgi:hypothetical protein
VYERAISVNCLKPLQNNKETPKQDDRRLAAISNSSPEADRRLLKLQYLLRNENLKLSKTGIINHLLENLNVEYLSKDLSDIFGTRSETISFRFFLIQK